MATIDLGKIKQVWRGTYNNSTAYTVDDVVSFTDNNITSSYICVANSTGNNPSSGGTAHASWNYLAKGVADPIPSQSGNSGKILQTDGSSLSFVDQAAGLKNSGTSQTVWFQTDSSTRTVDVNSWTECFSLSIPQQSVATKFIVYFTEERREQSWNVTQGRYQYSVDNGANWIDLGYSDRCWDTGVGGNARGARGSWHYWTSSGVWPVSFSANATPKFRLLGYKHGGSNAYTINTEAYSAITAFKVES